MKTRAGSVSWCNPCSHIRESDCGFLLADVPLTMLCHQLQLFPFPSPTQVEGCGILQKTAREAGGLQGAPHLRYLGD